MVTGAHAALRRASSTPTLLDFGGAHCRPGGGIGRPSERGREGASSGGGEGGVSAQRGGQLIAQTGRRVCLELPGTAHVRRIVLAYFFALLPLPLPLLLADRPQRRASGRFVAVSFRRRASIPSRGSTSSPSLIELFTARLAVVLHRVTVHEVLFHVFLHLQIVQQFRPLDQDLSAQFTRGGELTNPLGLHRQVRAGQRQQLLQHVDKHACDLLLLIYAAMVFNAQNHWEGGAPKREYAQRIHHVYGMVNNKEMNGTRGGASGGRTGLEHTSKWDLARQGSPVGDYRLAVLSVPAVELHTTTVLTQIVYISDKARTHRS